MASTATSAGAKMAKKKAQTFRIKPTKANEFKSIMIRAEDIVFLKETFDEVDGNESGLISRHEFSKNLNRFMSKEAQSFINDYMGLLDQNQDGQVSFQELVKVLYPGKSQLLSVSSPFVSLFPCLLLLPSLMASPLQNHQAGRRTSR